MHTDSFELMQVGMVSDADTFSLTFPQGCSTEIKAVLLGAVFLIDFMCELLRAFRPQPSSGPRVWGAAACGPWFCFLSPTLLLLSIADSLDRLFDSLLIAEAERRRVRVGSLRRTTTG